MFEASKFSMIPESIKRHFCTKCCAYSFHIIGFEAPKLEGNEEQANKCIKHLIEKPELNLVKIKESSLLFKDDCWFDLNNFKILNLIVYTSVSDPVGSVSLARIRIRIRIRKR